MWTVLRLHEIEKQFRADTLLTGQNNTRIKIFSLEETCKFPVWLLKVGVTPFVGFLFEDWPDVLIYVHLKPAEKIVFSAVKLDFFALHDGPDFPYTLAIARMAVKHGAAPGLQIIGNVEQAGQFIRTNMVQAFIMMRDHRPGRQLENEHFHIMGGALASVDKVEGA